MRFTIASQSPPEGHHLKLSDGQKGGCCLLVLQFVCFPTAGRAPCFQLEKKRRQTAHKPRSAAAHRKDLASKNRSSRTDNRGERGGRHASDGQIRRTRGFRRKTARHRSAHTPNASVPRGAEGTAATEPRNTRSCPSSRPRGATGPDLSYITHLRTILAIAAAAGDGRERRALSSDDTVPLF